MEDTRSATVFSCQRPISNVTSPCRSSSSFMDELLEQPDSVPHLFLFELLGPHDFFVGHPGGVTTDRKTAWPPALVRPVRSQHLPQTGHQVWRAHTDELLDFFADGEFADGETELILRNLALDVKFNRPNHVGLGAGR